MTIDPVTEQQHAATAARAEMARRLLVKRNLLHYVMMMVEGYEPGWVHYDVAARLERFMRMVERRQSPRLMLFMPPRTGKSELASVCFPAWVLGHHPNWSMIQTSYNLDLPLGFSRKVRSMLRDPRYQTVFTETRLDKDSQAAEEWNTTRRGSFVAAGAAGGLTGKGAHILTIDDPLKNMEDADNAALREAQQVWYETAAYTRLAPGGGVLLIQCQPGATLVRMADGTQKRLDAIVPGDRIVSYSTVTRAFVPATVTAARCSGTDQVYEIKTQYHRTLANARHPFLVEDRVRGTQLWVRARGLAAYLHDDNKRLVSLPVHDPLEPSAVALDEDLAWLIGWCWGTRSGVSPGGTRALLRTPCERPYRTVEQARAERIVHRHFGAQPSQFRRFCETHGLEMRGELTQPLPDYLTQPHAARTALVDGIVAAFGHPGSDDAETPVILTAPLAHEHVLESAVILARSVGRMRSTVYTRHNSAAEQTQAKIYPAKRTYVPNAPVLTAISGVTLLNDRLPVYDITVEGTECFVADGLVSHNTRWNADDLGGRLLKKMQEDARADQFELVEYPAIADQYEYRHPDTLQMLKADDPLDLAVPAYQGLELLRKPGEYLNPERFTPDMVERIRSNISPRNWSALYQQRPIPDGGLMFKDEHLRWLDQLVLRSHLGFRIIMAWDFAIESKKHNDYTVGMTLALSPQGHLYVVNIIRGKFSTYQIVDEICNEALRWRDYPFTVGAEDGQIYKTLKPVLEMEMKTREFWFPVTALVPTTDKLVRARPLQARFEQKHITLLRSCPHVAEFVRELIEFPAGAHDDTVDAAAWAIRLANAAGTLVMPKNSPKLASWRDKLSGAAGQSTSYMGA